VPAAPQADSFSLSLSHHTPAAKPGLAAARYARSGHTSTWPNVPIMTWDGPPGCLAHVDTPLWPRFLDIMAPKAKAKQATAGKGKGKGKGEEEEQASGKLKPAQSINVRHILVSGAGHRDRG